MAPGPSQSSPNADTVDAPADAVPSDFSSRPNWVGFVEGSRPELTRETTDLLRSRLRAAAGFLGLGFGLFFVYRLILGGTVELERDSFVFHAGVLVALGLAFVLLCRHCAISIRKLRFYELVIFGLPVLYFLESNYQIARIWANRGYLPSLLPY